MRRRFALVFTTTLAALATGLAVGFALVGAPTRAAAPSNPYAWFAPLVDVERAIADRFVTAPDLEAMQAGAIAGMIEALNDPYTEFIPATLIPEFDKQIRGRYVGIGASVNMVNGGLTIVSPLDDSPAFHAGVMAGDVVLAVNGEPVTGLPIDAAIEMLSGEPGTTVVVTIRRAGETFDLPIVRQRIVTRTVSGWRRLGEQWDYMIDPAAGVGYARLAQFNATTPAELRDAIEKMRGAGMKGLVLDLRFNPGGLFVAAIQIADMFLDRGLIVRTDGRAHEEQTVFAHADGTLPDFPVAIVVNGQSASASEVLAGALADNGRAVVVGTRTFGKGAMQNVIPLPSGAGQLKITEQHYFGPSGRMIHRTDDSTEWGVDPTDGFYVTMSDAATLDMLRIQRDNAIIRNGPARSPATPASADWIAAELSDAQLAAAVRGVVGKITAGEWTRASDQSPALAADLEELTRMREARERIIRDLARVDRRLAALSSVAPEDQLPEAESLVPEGADLTGGSVVLRDAAGKEVTTLRITGPGLARWLIDAPVAPSAPASTPGAPKP